MIRWGIIGCGAIAPKFFHSLETCAAAGGKKGEGQVVAAASKSMHRAKRFQKKTGVERIYDSYEQMLEREKLDAVYVATSHNFHYENTKLCFEHDVPVLVEKAFARNEAEAEELIDVAQLKNLFLMEAMWTRFNPVIIKLCELLRDGAIGEVKHLRAAFCVKMNPLSLKMSPWNRMYSPRLAGGALLDLGVYAVSFARMVFGQPPARISSTAKMAWTGVDATSEYNLDYPGEKRAELISSFRMNRPRDAVITGSAGIIRIPEFMHPSQMVLTRPGRAPETLTTEPDRLDHGGPGFQHEIREVHRCLREGLIESPVMPLQETLDIIRTMDACRTQWGMKYPGE